MREGRDSLCKGSVLREISAKHKTQPRLGEGKRAVSIYEHGEQSLQRGHSITTSDPFSLVFS